MPDVLHNIGSWPPRRAALTGGRMAVVDAHRSLDYRTLEARCQAAAGLLRAHGVERGDRVGLLLGNRSAYLEIVFAAARLGAIAVPINTRLAAREIEHILGDCSARLLFHEADLGKLASAARGAAGAPALFPVGGEPDAYERELERQTPVAEVEPVSPDDPMLLMYTSGTTGKPKGALLPHRKTLANTLNAQLFFQITGESRVLIIVPMFHSFGLKILSIPVIYGGGLVVMQPRFDPASTWRAVAEHRINFFGAVPSMFRALYEELDARPTDYDLTSLDFAFTAGSAIPVELIRDFQQRGLLLKQGFGQTETSILTALEAEDAIPKAGSVGRPVFHADVRVMRTDNLTAEPSDWQETSAGETGEIVVRGQQLMLGYWQRPEATAETIRGEWLRTGDLATRDDDGYITLVGRERDMYISGGENVYPAQVEATLEEHPDIREVAVVGVPDERWGETGHAHLVLREGAELDSDALRSWARERLAAFKVPTGFFLHRALPRTVTGKVQKFLLKGG